MILNKPSGLSCQGLARSDDLSHFLPYLNADQSEELKCVTTLDKYATGLVALARNAKSFGRLTKAMEANKLSQTVGL